MLIAGVASILVAAFIPSSFLAILGTALIFWGVVLLFITPGKHVPMALLNASSASNSDNLERVLSEFGLTAKGVYLPPENLKNAESSLIFVPKEDNVHLPSPDEITEKITSKDKNGIYLSPPGFALSSLFEKEIATSFAKVDLAFLQNRLPRLLVENLDLAQKAELEVQGKTIIVTLTGSLFSNVCSETDKQPHVHAQIGCLLTSALACVLAKTTGKPITIQDETRNPETKQTIITFSVEERF